MNNKDCQKGTLTTFLDQYKEDNKNPNLVKPKDWNLISAFKSKFDPIWLVIILTAILVCSIFYFGWNFVYQKYVPLTESSSVLLPR